MTWLADLEHLVIRVNCCDRERVAPFILALRKPKSQFTASAETRPSQAGNVFEVTPNSSREAHPMMLKPRADRILKLEDAA
jgi:hypothetical protein